LQGLRLFAQLGPVLKPALTGSHNWTGPSLDSNDESPLKIEDTALFNSYIND
jgi:phosphatidylserine/phosphatidylglycerophosphate/cardiolipin synthase-like enzyme